MGTPLMVAVTFQYPEVVQLVVDVGINVNIADEFGNNALNIATFFPSTVVIYILIEGGSELNMIGWQGRTALDHAIANSAPEIADVIREAGGKTAAELNATE